MLTFLSWMLSRVASRAPGCTCVAVQRWRLPSLAPLSPPPPAPLTSQCTALAALRAAAYHGLLSQPLPRKVLRSHCSICLLLSRTAFFPGVPGQRDDFAVCSRAARLWSCLWHWLSEGCSRGHWSGSHAVTVGVSYS